MKRYIFVSVAVVVFAVVAAACGRDEGVKTTAAYKPTGEAARLRLEVVGGAARCDGTPRDVRVWLDDLPREPAPSIESPGRRHEGLIGAQFEIRFDPAVVWIESPEDVALNDELNTLVDARPNFILAPPYIDNYSGTAFLGVLALGVAGDKRVAEPGVQVPTPLPVTKGIDPMAVGAPVLLMTVGILPVGHGDSDVRLEDVKLLAGAGWEFGPVESADAAITVDGDCEERATATPRVTPTSTPVAPPTPDAVPTSRPLTPVPATTNGRSDCPDGWLTYVSPADARTLSVCFPDGYLPRYRAGTPRSGQVISVSNAAKGVFIGVQFVDQTPVSSGAVSSIEELCAMLEDAHGGLPVEPVAIPLSIGEALGCQTLGDAGDGGLDPLTAFVSLDGDRFLQIAANGRTDDDEIRHILSTLRLR